MVERNAHTESWPGLARWSKSVKADQNGIEGPLASLGSTGLVSDPRALSRGLSCFRGEERCHFADLGLLDFNVPGNSDQPTKRNPLLGTQTKRLRSVFSGRFVFVAQNHGHACRPLPPYRASGAESRRTRRVSATRSFSGLGLLAEFFERCTTKFKLTCAAQSWPPLSGS